MTLESQAAKILVVGAGSAGRRHARNFQSLGASIDCFDPRSDRYEEMRSEIPVNASYKVFDDALAAAKRYQGVVIASPPAFHVDQSIAFMRFGVPVLLEKPISPDLKSALRLQEAVQETKTPVLLGYSYRWWPPLLEMRKRIDAGAIGVLRHARFVMSAHLADWHPWERYQDFFMASRELGGGALLDESHFLDLMVWLFGRPEALTGRVEHLSSLEISTDDNVDLIAEYSNGLRVSIHLDLYGRPHEKSVTVVGENGTLHCGFDPNIVRQSANPGGDWNATVFNCERNDMFLGVAREFMGMLRDRKPRTCTVTDGVEVLRLVEMVRRSTRERRPVMFQEVEHCVPS